MERYRFEIHLRLAGEMKQSYTYIDLVRCLGACGLRDVVLRRIGLLRYKDTALEIHLPAHMDAEETQFIGHDLMRQLGEALGSDPRHFSGTLFLTGEGRASEHGAEETMQMLTDQGLAVSLDLLLDNAIGSITQ